MTWILLAWAVALAWGGWTRGAPWQGLGLGLVGFLVGHVMWRTLHPRRPAARFLVNLPNGPVFLELPPEPGTHRLPAGGAHALSVLASLDLCRVDPRVLAACIHGVLRESGGRARFLLLQPWPWYPFRLWLALWFHVRTDPRGRRCGCEVLAPDGGAHVPS